MKRSSSVSKEAGSSQKRRRQCSGSEEEDMKYTPLIDPPMSKIYNSSFRNHKPAELFRKDLISAMKIADSEQLTPEDYWNMTDTWKQEWEKGVQVPVNPDGLPHTSFRKMSKCKFGDFKLPKKFIRCTHDEFFSNDLHILTNVVVQAERVCRYDLDDLDFQWLKMLNEERDDLGLPPIPESEMEVILEELESQCFNNLQEAIKNEEGLGIEYDEDVICDVCRSPDSEDGNEMVFCDSCNICVHQACYGITTIPEGSWVCRTCALGFRPPCVLCPNRGGAMKSTRSGQKWAHVSCALWVPEVSIGCVDKMEPITKISLIPASRWALLCSICRERVGACIQCSVKTCKTAYHITCAFKDGLEMKAIIDEENEEDGVKLRSFCEKHSKKKEYVSTSDSECEAPPRKSERGRRELEMSTEEKASARAQRIRILEAEFYSYVNTKETSDLLQIDGTTVNFIFNYWKLKRKANFNKALLTPKAEESDILVKQQEDSLYARMKMFVHLRQDLERVRNLCYMVNRREKLSRSFFKIREDIFRKQAALLNTKGVKMTEKEKEAILQANRSESIYDQLYTFDRIRIPSLHAIVSVLEGKDSPTLNIYSPRKSPKKSPELHRLPNPYAKQYVNGVRRSNRRFSSLFEFDKDEKPDWLNTSDSIVQKMDTELLAGEDDGFILNVDGMETVSETPAPEATIASKDEIKREPEHDRTLPEESEIEVTEPEKVKDVDLLPVGRLTRKNNQMMKDVVTSPDSVKKNLKDVFVLCPEARLAKDNVPSEIVSPNECKKPDLNDVVDSEKQIHVPCSETGKIELQTKKCFVQINKRETEDAIHKDVSISHKSKALNVISRRLRSGRDPVKVGSTVDSVKPENGKKLLTKSNSESKLSDSSLPDGEKPKVEGTKLSKIFGGSLSGYRIPKRVRTDGNERENLRGHLPISPLSSVAQKADMFNCDSYQKPRYNRNWNYSNECVDLENFEDASAQSPRLVIKLRKDPDYPDSHRWRSDNLHSFQVVQNDWDSPQRRSERQRKALQQGFVYRDNGGRYPVRFRTVVNKPSRSEFFS